ncbi:hypothetical protein [Persicobacter psychrovividus]|uniref:Uncharacterized protein n=1 Tax=Persicobacter psychrovividus TaxID=387638 RepID=A0ABM7VMF3_9BACT|nr:hypothetical protein PEPS_44760 [Persicobacter psychrovividus]
MSDKLLNPTHQLIEQHLGALTKNEELPEDMQQLTEWLYHRVKYMLAHEQEQLAQAMYRIDVAEPLFHEALSGIPSADVAANLTKLILDREQKKAYWREKYKNGI